MTNGFTPETCRERCADYKFFALQNDGECFCGNAYGTAAQYKNVPNSECDKGNGVEFGHGFRNAVFSNDLWREPDFCWVGCYVDDAERDLQEGPMTYGFTPETCHERCAAYKFFALQNNGQCFCGNAYGTEPQYVDVDKSECVAEGNGQKDAHFYGDGWRNAVFRNNLYTAPEPAPQPVPEP